MNLPKAIKDLVDAQNSFDSTAYANCFAETAVVSDEGRTHNGRGEIRDWIEEANQKYRSVMRPLDYTENGASGVLSAECSGTFPGSPVVLKFHFGILDGKIRNLKVTG
ncbi:nuclear transport factor 2 family protein [Flavobacterium sp. MAH-1]|uniref:Nuclear transport factor 2 family protein n=1 Tax=Flavobacterium agri TaxID=2743471 RepID=A0A7Y8Y1W0_9FLAO|nr:nuclear transport factor 2 family protein [Flavobacterium agri]NUY79640.1 nuclear transport factor 2 family protein [Flavobacterium agri]NYA69665.1 nuclear transport factor 2 family protein [Flavobacterium agri]